MKDLFPLAVVGIGCVGLGFCVDEIRLEPASHKVTTACAATDYCMYAAHRADRMKDVQEQLAEQKLTDASAVAHAKVQAEVKRIEADAQAYANAKLEGSVKDKSLLKSGNLSSAGTYCSMTVNNVCQQYSIGTSNP